MQSIQRVETTPELVPLNVIRVETVLARYPVHRLAKTGTIAIEIREESENGEVLVRWEVDSSRKYGQPGPLAYKLDTLIINRKIDEVGRPVPRIIRLGSLTEIAEQLRLGGDTNKVKKALRQNAFAGIIAKLLYRDRDGTERTLEADFTRYAVVFTGERLPDGRTADAVYLVLNDIFMQVINGAQTRPLDYDYLRDLPPASQRLYELLSFQMYAALKHGRPRAKLTYSEFCTYAPLKRSFDKENTRCQMKRIHAPHKQSGYIADVEFEQTTDKTGKPDWSMLYTPGPKAKAEYRTFTKKGGPRVLEVEASSAAPEPTPAPKPEPKPEPTPLERELIERGVTAATAAELVREYAEERIAAQVERTDWTREKHPKKIRDCAAYLVDAIKKDYAAPPGFVSRAERARREEEARAKLKADAEQRRRIEEAKAREREAQAQIAAYLESLSPEALSKLEAEALEQAGPETRESYHRQHPGFKRLYLKSVREAHVRALLNLPPKSDA
jgi:hypothetical protein